MFVKNILLFFFFFLLLFSYISCFDNILWRHWSNTHSGSFSSDLESINLSNINNLKLLWNYTTNNTIESGVSEESTPIVVEDGHGGYIFIFCTGDSVSYALDPETGFVKWINNNTKSKPFYQGGGTCRGVESWINPLLNNNDICKVQIIYGTLDMKLIALDAYNGNFCPHFGNNGIINLCDFIPKCSHSINNSLPMGVTSPPIVIRDTIIVGNAIADSVEQNIAPGIILAFNVSTGEYKWEYNPIPYNHSNPGYKTWKNGTYNVGGGNVWSCMSGDDYYGIVYLPTTSPSVDQYGGERIGSNLYTNAIVALNVTTGNTIWFFQTVHHDLWDYDNPSQPAIMNITNENGISERCIILPTKMGFIFVFNALTGHPYYDIKEYPVPSISDVNGEVPFPTQPFPNNKLSTLIPLQFTINDIFSINSDDYNSCLKLYNNLKGIQEGKIFTPPSINGFLQYPLKTGVINYGGISFYEKEQIIVFKSVNLAFAGIIFEQDSLPPNWCLNNPVIINQMDGTPYSVCFTKFQASSGIPCVKPPYSSLVAVNISSVNILWNIPFGETSGYDPIWGSISGNKGGQLILTSGIVFAAGTDDLNLWAFDLYTGNILWTYKLSDKVHGSPIAYKINDKEYISIIAETTVYTFSL